jgi:nicotinate-nucleotide adenylyltransferase
VNSALRIGIFGGTFDPIHLGHLAIARAALAQAHLSKVLFVIAADPPHKPGQTITPVHLRVAMVNAALQGEAAFELSEIELERPGPSYTAVTLAHIQQTLPTAQLFFIIGYDSALDFPKWYRPGEILQHADLLIAPRPENKEPLPALLDDHHQLLDMKEWSLSSSHIRDTIRAGSIPVDTLPDSVITIIRKEGLYSSCP